MFAAAKQFSFIEGAKVTGLEQIYGSHILRNGCTPLTLSTTSLNGGKNILVGLYAIKVHIRLFNKIKKS